jgi:hypothetical protein
MLFAQVTLPPPETIRSTAAEVVARPDYDLGQHDLKLEPPFWLEMFRWILTPFEWLYDSMEGVPDVFRWIIVIVAALVCVALIAHIIYTLVTAIRGPIRSRGTKYEFAVEEIDPVDLESEADRISHRGDYIGAIRLLFRASLRRLELAERRKFRPGFTNRELLRRYRASPLAAALERLVETIELKWYGDAPCVQDDYTYCRAAHDYIRQHVRDSQPAVRP